MSRRDAIGESNGDEANKSVDKNWEIVRHHAPSPEGIRRISNMRAATKQMLDAIDANCPPCADSTFAKRLARMAMMIANGSIVLDGMV